jgi:hypothetical protein
VSKRNPLRYSTFSAAPGGTVGNLATHGRKAKRGLLSIFTLSEARLFFVLADECKVSGEVRASNRELMWVCGLDEHSFRRARASLEHNHRWIETEPVNGTRGEQHVYRVVKTALRRAERDSGKDNTASDDWVLTRIPDEVFHAILNPAPKL